MVQSSLPRVLQVEHLFQSISILFGAVVVAEENIAFRPGRLMGDTHFTRLFISVFHFHCFLLVFAVWRSFLRIFLLADLLIGCCFLICTRTPYYYYYYYYYYYALTMHQMLL